MIQKQKIEAQYLKLIGVTLMMTAACISDSGNKHALSFVDDNVREIILEQFHRLSSDQLSEEIEWDYAIKQVAKSNTKHGLSSKYAYYEVLVIKKALKALTDNSLGVITNEIPFNYSYLSFWEPFVDLINYDTAIRRNKYSLISRAGPIA